MSKKRYRTKAEQAANPVQTTGIFGMKKGPSASPVDAGNPFRYDDFPSARALSSAG